MISCLNYFDILTKILWHTTFMLRQGHDSAPGLDIMLLKQQLLSVSGQVANPARQHPPVEYVYRSSHPLLQFLPQKLAEWIANSYAEELNVPLRPDLSQPWSTVTLNRILQTCLLSDSKGNNIHSESHLPDSRVRVRSVLRDYAAIVYARPLLPIQYGTSSI